MMPTTVNPASTPDAKPSSSTPSVGPTEATDRSPRVAQQRDGAAVPAPSENAATPEPVLKVVAPQELEGAVTTIREFMKLSQRALDFTVDEATGHPVVTVRNKDTQEIVRQIPPEEALTVARVLRELDAEGRHEAIAGLLLEREV
jgi:flagellar protein FlaG